MKRVLVIVVVIFTAIFSVSCSNNSDEDSYDYQEGYNLGYEEGYDEGYSDGLYEGTEIAKEDIYDEYYLDDYDWMMDNVVFYTDAGECYHKKYCRTIEDSSIYVSYPEDAQKYGYRECSICFIDEPRIEKD